MSGFCLAVGQLRDKATGTLLQTLKTRSLPFAPRWMQPPVREGMAADEQNTFQEPNSRVKTRAKRTNPCHPHVFACLSVCLSVCRLWRGLDEHDLRPNFLAQNHPVSPSREPLRDFSHPRTLNRFSTRRSFHPPERGARPPPPPIDGPSPDRLYFSSRLLA